MKWVNIQDLWYTSLLWMVYSTETVSAEQALAHGLVSRLAPPGELDAVADGFVDGLIGKTREAIVTCKRYLGHARLMETGAAHDLAGNMLSVVLASK